jgi:hypothetical protein
MLLLKFILDNWSVEKTFKGIKELELSGNGVTIVKALSEDGGESSLEFFDSLSEFVEVVIKLSFLDVHDIILHLHELHHGFVELIIDLVHTGGKGLTFCVTNENIRELVELQDGAGQVHDVLASLQERIESHKQSVSRDFPLVLGLSLVVKVGVFELEADIKSKREFAVGLL